MTVEFVLDTNVLVSALLTPGGPPGHLLDAVIAERLRPVYCPPILSEYERVLRRPRFGFAPRDIDDLLEFVALSGRGLSRLEDPGEDTADPDDAVFYACAFTARCPLVTGNLPHFPRAGPVTLLKPRQAIVRLERA